MNYDAETDTVFEVTSETTDANGATHTSVHGATVDTVVSWALLFGVDASTAWEYMLQAHDEGLVDADGRTVWADLIEAVDNAVPTVEAGVMLADVELDEEDSLADVRAETLNKLGVKTPSSMRRARRKKSELDSIVEERKQTVLQQMVEDKRTRKPAKDTPEDSTIETTVVEKDSNG